MLGTLTVSVDDADPPAETETLVVLKDRVTPDIIGGEVPPVRETVPANPLMLSAVIVVEPVAPCATVRNNGSALMLKSAVLVQGPSPKIALAGFSNPGRRLSPSRVRTIRTVFGD
jgi:hypothetical protein